MKRLKNILMAVIVLISSTQTCFAQRRIHRSDYKDIKNGDYIIDSLIDKFVGVWEVRRAPNEVFRIVFIKGTFIMTELGVTSETLFGWHKFIWHTTNPVENSFASFGSTDITKSTVSAISANDDELLIQFHDVTKNKAGRASLKLLPGKTDQATWTLKETIGLKGGDFSYGFSVPIDWVFVKISSNPNTYNNW